MIRKTLLFIFLFSSIVTLKLHAQSDSVRFENGNILVGEIKSMDKGVLTMKTDYSDSDFKIEWEKIKWINTQTNFLITLSKSDHIYWGRLMSVSDSVVNLVVRSGMLLGATMKEIVNLEPIEDKFADRISASIDVGLNLAKAQNLGSFSTDMAIGYKADRWSSDLSLNSLYSRQDDIDAIKRIESGFNYRYVFTRGTYGITTFSTLTNTEQKLDMRFSAQLGYGLYAVRTNHSYLGFMLGANRNIENYTTETDDRNSWEGYVGAELNMFDVGDVSLSTALRAYPGITETGRWRSDIKFDVKYDIFDDFYVKLGLSINYDNQPAEGATETDYVVQTGFGWEW